MRIELLRNLGRGFPPLKEGEATDVDTKLGELLCKRGLAREIKAVPTQPIKAVPPKEPDEVAIGKTVEKAEETLKAFVKKTKKAEASE